MAPLLVVAFAAAALVAENSQAGTVTYQIGPNDGVGTQYLPGDQPGAWHPVYSLGDLPANAYLTSVSINGTLYSTDGNDAAYPSELIAYFDNQNLPASGNAPLQIGPYMSPYGYYYDYGAAQKLGWSNGYSGPVSSVVDTKTYGIDFTTNLNLNNTALSVVNGYSGSGIGGFWGGTLTVNYQIGAPAVPTATWAQTAAATYDWNDSGNWSGTFPNAQDAFANMNIAYAGAQTVNLNQAITVGKVWLGDNGNSYGSTIAGNGGSLIVDSSSGTASINRFNGVGRKDTISADVQLNCDTVVSDANGSFNDSFDSGLVISGNITGGKNLIKMGGGAVMLTGTGNVLNSVTLDNGYLGLSNTALGSGTLVINGGAIDGFNNGAHSSLTLTNNNPIVVNGDFSTYYGFNTGNGPITLARAGIKITGNITLAGSVSGPGNLNALDIAYWGSDGANNNPTITAPITLRPGGQTVTVMNPSQYATTDVHISGAIGDGGGGYGLTVDGNTRLWLDAANTYSGDTVVVTGDHTGGVGTIVVLGNNLTLQYSAIVTGGRNFGLGNGITAPTIGGLKGSTDLALTFNKNTLNDWWPDHYGSVTALTLNPLSGVCTYSGAIADGAAGMTLTKNGGGAQELSGNNTYTGQTTLNAGTLVVSGSLSGTPNLVLNGGTLASGPTGYIAGAVNAGGVLPHTIAPGGVGSIGTLSIGGSSYLSSDTTLNIDLGSSGSADLLAIAGNLSIDGGNQVKLDFQYTPGSLSRSYTLATFTSFNGNTSNFLLDATAPAGYNLSIVGNELLLNGAVPSVWQGGSAHWNSVNTGSWVNNTVPNLAGAEAVFNQTSGGTTTVTLDSPQTVGTIVLGGSASPTSYSLTGSTLTMNNNGSGATITVANGKHAIETPLALTSGLDVSGSGTLTFSGSISGTGPLTMSGTNGTLVLSGTGLYTGGTVVSAGILAVTTSAALPDNQSLTVGAGGTLIFDPSYVAAPIVFGQSLAVSPVPEPSTLALLFAGLVVGFGAWRRKK